MTSDHARLAASAGRLWAEQKADSLRDVVPAVDWPDVWDDARRGKLPFLPGEVPDAERAALAAEAVHAAHERWRELVTEQRAAEGGESQDELDAIRLFDALARDLPPGITAGREGERVYVQEFETGTEHTVTSLEDAWRVVAEWEENLVRRP